MDLILIINYLIMKILVVERSIINFSATDDFVGFVKHKIRDQLKYVH